MKRTYNPSKLKRARKCAANAWPPQTGDTKRRRQKGRKRLTAVSHLW